MHTTTSPAAWGGPETKFFYDLTPERILDAVDSLGFHTTGRCFALNSMENRVYEVEIEVDDVRTLRSPSERFRIVKFYRPGRWSKEQILEEHQFLADLREIEVPVVAPLPFEDGETLRKVDGSEIWCAVFPKVGGRNPDELSDEQLPIIGRLLARMHNCGSIRQAPHRVRITPETYGLQSLAYLQEQKVLPPHLEAQFAEAVRAICELSAPWFAEAAVQRIHGDCHLGNLLWGVEGPFWVDFDDMLNGPCIQDLWLLLPGRDDHARKQLDILLEGYEQMREFDRRTLRLIEPLRALRMIHFNAWIAKRWEDPAFPRVFVNFGTERHWSEQVQQLREQQALIEQSALGGW